MNYKVNKPKLSIWLYIVSIGILIALFGQIIQYDEGIFTNSVILTFGLFLVLLVIIRLWGLFSVPFCLSFFIVYPGFTPFYSFTIMKADYFKMGNKFIQDDIHLIYLAEYYILMSSIVMIVFIYGGIIYFRKNITSNYISTKILIPIGSGWALFFCVLTLTFAYLTDPGSTILTHRYIDVINERFSNTEFAGGLFVIFWVLAFVNFQMARQKKIFILVTILSIIWFILHAKRAPVLGILLVFLFYFYQSKKLSLKLIIISTLLVFILFAVGEVRNSSLFSYKIASFFETNDVASLPGNGAGVFLTLMGTIYITDEIYNGFLYGTSYLNEFYGIIPTPLLRLFDMPLPVGYGTDKYAAHLYYLGGMHLLAPAYANFGVLGILFLSAIVGWLIAYIHSSILSQSLDKRVHAYVLIIFFPASMWYNVMILVSWTVYLFILLFALHILTQHPRKLSFSKHNMPRQ
jgi:hypothetical protein